MTRGWIAVRRSRYRPVAVRRAIGILALLLTGAAVVEPAGGQNVDRFVRRQPVAGWDVGFDLFESMLQVQGLHPASPGRRLPAERTVIVLTGHITADQRTALPGWLNAGAAVLVATDESVSVPGLFQIRSGPVLDHRRAWMGYADCPIAVSVRSSRLTGDVRRLVMNGCGWIERLEPWAGRDWDIHAEISSTAQPRRSRGRPVLASLTWRRGRLIVLSDDSPLTNSMLWHGDNRLLLHRLTENLTSDGRSELLFLNSGRPVQGRLWDLLEQRLKQSAEEREQIPPEALNDLPGDVLLKIGNDLLAEIEDSGVLNDLVADRPRRLPARFYRRAVLLAVCGAAAAWFLVRSWRGIRKFIPWQPAIRRPPETGPAPLTMNLHEAAAALARDLCRELTGSADPEVWDAQLGPDGAVRRRLAAVSKNPDTVRQTLDEAIRQARTKGRSSEWTRDQFESFGRHLYDLRQWNHRQARTSPVLVEHS